MTGKSGAAAKPAAAHRQAMAVRWLAVLILCALLAGIWSVRSWLRTAAIRDHLDRAEAAARISQSPEAMAEWQAALRLDPKNQRIYEMMIQYAMATGQWGRAVEALHALQQALPQAKHIYCRLAACQLRQDDHQGALESAKEELKHDPNCVAALGLLTSVMAMQPSADESLQLEYLSRLCRLTPNDIEFQHMYAEALTNLYRYDDLRPVVAKILQLNPQDAEAYNLLGYADLASPRQPEGLQQARKDFETSLALNPANGGAHFGLGRVALRQGRAKEAVAQLEVALKMRPEAVRINFELTQAYRLAGMPKQAEAANHRFLQWQHFSTEHRKLEVRCLAYPNDPRYPRQLGLLLAENGGDPAEAAYYLKKALQLAPGDPTASSALRRLQPSSHSMPPEQAISANATPFR